MTLWKTIFKNEIRRKTYLFRKNRKLFFIVIYAIFLFWAIYLGPVFFDTVIPELIKQFSEMFEPMIINIVESTFMMLFLLYIMYPIFMLYRKPEIGYKDILLASPIKPGDIFVGEFLGQIPFYSLLILGIGPIINSLFLQVNPDLTVFHYIGIYLMIFLLIIFGLLIGTTIANWLERKMMTKNRLKNLNYSLVVLLSFLLIICFYIFHFIFNFISENPEFKSLMIIYPSYWYSNVLLYLINPLIVEAYILNIWLNIGLAIIIPPLIFFISYKNANTIYTIDQKLGSVLMNTRYDKKINRFLRKITPQGYKRLVDVQFKEFFRKRENIPKLIYVGAFTGILGLFVFFSLEDPLLAIGDTWLIAPYLIQIFYFKYLLMMILSWMGGLIFGIFMGIYVLIGSKDIIFLYKKSIRGIKPLIYSFFYEMIYLIIFLDTFLTIFFTILFPLDFLSALTFFFLYPINTLIILIQATGIQCIKPMFEERGKNVYFNIYLTIFIQVTALLIATFIIVPIIPAYIDHSLGLLYILLTNTGLSAGIALLLIYLGIRKLNRLE
ncbi:MAG: hypothetical protein ACFE75_07430 [Candidatus Hodarchaeota archaeon]